MSNQAKTQINEDGFLRLKLNSNLKKQLQNQPKSAFGVRPPNIGVAHHFEPKVKDRKNESFFRPNNSDDRKTPMIVGGKSNEKTGIKRYPQNAGKIHKEARSNKVREKSAKILKDIGSGRNASGGKRAFPHITSTSAKSEILIQRDTIG